MLQTPTSMRNASNCSANVRKKWPPTMHSQAVCGQRVSTISLIALTASSHSSVDGVVWGEMQVVHRMGCHFLPRLPQLKLRCQSLLIGPTFQLHRLCPTKVHVALAGPLLPP